LCSFILETFVQSKSVKTVVMTCSMRIRGLQLSRYAVSVTKGDQ